KASQTGHQQEKQNAPFLKIRFPEGKTHFRPRKDLIMLLLSEDVLRRVRLHLTTSAGRPGQSRQADRLGPWAGSTSSSPRLHSPAV
uniref:Uncharacterized protein n=1 Tax=Triticum urartu TaxID=4572 RepID=A0A8R7U9Y6_TRIUA